MKDGCEPSAGIKGRNLARGAADGQQVQPTGEAGEGQSRQQTDDRQHRDELEQGEAAPHV